MLTRVIQRAALLAFSIAAGLAMVEGLLALDGRFDSLAERKLVSSPAIWEPPSNATDYESHPDLNLKVEIRCDKEGVRNHSTLATDQKRNIVAFFGDSYTENRRIDDRFTFTTLLDDTTDPSARVVNYGVDGYGLDQAYLRYKKYEAHDIRHVVYVYCGNDLRNLYETGLVEVTPGNHVVVRTPHSSVLYRTLGRLRLTYLIMSAYYRLTGSSSDIVGDELRGLNWAQDPTGYDARNHDEFAQSINADALLARPQQKTVELARTFILLLKTWRDEVEARDRSFTVFVLPDPGDMDLAMTLLRPFDGRIVYLSRYFASGEAASFTKDKHWNEYGNLEMAQVLTRIPDLPFHSLVMNPGFLDGRKSHVDQYYREHR